MGKTPDYIKRARKNYNDKFHKVSVRFPKNYGDADNQQLIHGGEGWNVYITNLVSEDLAKRGIKL